MSIQNAINFINVYHDNLKLRAYLGLLNSPDEVRSFLEEIGMAFFDEELEEAYHLMLVKCSDEAEHNRLSQIRISYFELTRK